MVPLKESSNKEILQTQYEQLWIEFLNSDENKVERILNRAQRELLPTKEKWLQRLKPFQTHLLWIVPLSALIVAILLYVIFIWVALLVE
ncbi:hypothetical protein [Paenibacillus sp. HW567]|uniref:hypothetical protein n=1 Tax=Paenibacillus sp. HW567 TaxID=1034769 RepID=UPI00037EC2CB|nr:hypothetical protein [Paenibacillus sp. HW567]